MLPTFNVRTITDDSTAEPIYYENRAPILWSDVAVQEADFYYNRLYFRPKPNYSSHVNSGSNSFMYSNQEMIYQASLKNGYPRCPAYAPLPDIYGEDGIYKPSEFSEVNFTEEFSKFFASAVYDCPTCYNYSSTSGAYFDGTLWVADLDDDDSSSYRYSYLSFNGTDIASGDDQDDYFPVSVCPDFLGRLINKPYYSEVSNTRNVMTYLNLLSNSLYDPNVVGKTLPIQTGTSEYGHLFFDAAGVARIVSLFLSIFALLLMNGTWPLAVWRLSYERSQRIALMMKTVGMRSYAYVLGMYSTDMLIACVFSVGAMVGAVELNFSRFKNAPLAFLVLTAVLSAHALNCFAILLVQVYSNRSTLLSLMSAVFSVASTIGSLLLIVIKYPNDGDWPNALSLIPFFAQSRCVYILLVYHKVTDEVSIALTLLFAFGIACMVTSLVLEYEINIPYLIEYFRNQANLQVHRNFEMRKPEEGTGDIELGEISGNESQKNNREQPAVDEGAPNSLFCFCQKSEYVVIPAKNRLEQTDVIDDDLVDEDVVRENHLMNSLTSISLSTTVPSLIKIPEKISDPQVAIGICQVRYTYPTSLSGIPGTRVSNIQTCENGN